MKVIYFIDVKCKRPYTFETMAQRAIGGTESTLLRVADRLASDYRVYLVQFCREVDDLHESGISYIGMSTARRLAFAQPPDHVVLSRKIKLLRDMAAAFPGAKHYLWIQDLPLPKYARYRQDLVDCDATLICNSNWQRRIAEQYLSPDGWYQRLFHPLGRLQAVATQTIYNVIDPAIRYEETVIDDDKLVFFSAPRKGLKEVLACFREVIRLRPQCKLYIANPGYEAMDAEWMDHPNLINLGSLSNAAVIQHVREAFCVFYPQAVLPETFGVIYAEANSVGTPVLGYDIGAASEILSNPDQLMAVSDKDVAGKLMSWYEKGRPAVTTRPEYALDNVEKNWRGMLAGFE